MANFSLRNELCIGSVPDLGNERRHAEGAEALQPHHGIVTTGAGAGAGARAGTGAGAAASLGGAGNTRLVND